LGDYSYGAKGVGSLLESRQVSGPGEGGFRECGFFKIPRVR
jgi:hypothetical protein